MRGPCSGCFVSWLSSVDTAALTVSAASCREGTQPQARTHTVSGAHAHTISGKCAMSCCACLGRVTHVFLCVSASYGPSLSSGLEDGASPPPGLTQA